MKKSLLFVICIFALCLFIVSCGDKEGEKVSDTSDTTLQTELAPEEKDEDFEKAAKVLKTENDLDYAVLSTIYYYNADGTVMAIKQNAVYEDEQKADYDFAVMEAMTDYFSEYRQDGVNLYCTVSETAIAKYFPNSDMDSVIKSAEENSLSYEIMK